MICRPHGTPRGCGRRPGGGFTLIELLVVVAIISILASIAMPNFLEAQTRAKVSRVKADMRTLATALESYRVDHNNYPRRQLVPIGGAFSPLGDVTKRAEDLSRLTSPIAHITKVPFDIFEYRVPNPNNTFEYWNHNVFINPTNPSLPRDPAVRGPIPNWLLFSCGPNSDLGTSAIRANLPYTPENAFGYLHDYDPTNGTISRGNIYRGSGGEQAIDIYRR
jgi:type II secretion system protein G